MFLPGQIYNRRKELHEIYGGQEQGGISTPAKHKMIFIFKSSSGEQYGYADGWRENGNFYYTGEGQLGDMTFKGGNLAIRDHIQNGEDIHLFEYVNTGNVRYVGRMKYLGHHFQPKPDQQGNSRQAIIFELAPVDFKK